MGYDHIYLQKQNGQRLLQQCQTETAKQMRETKEAAIAKQQAENRTKAFEAERRELEAYRLQLEKDIQVSCASSTLQRAYAQASKDRARAANLVYQQRLKAMKTEVHSHITAITGLKFQLNIVKAELLSFDLQDAIDMQLEDERRLPATAVTARPERELKRTANENVIKDLTSEIEHFKSQISKAKANFETAHKSDCVRMAKLSLRDLQRLKNKKACAGHGEHKFKFWNAVRRATTKGSPSAKDLKVFEAYRHELERPVFDLTTGAPPTRQAVEDYAFSCVQEQGGVFSIKDFAR
jgi:hypothetical protein